jgi:hypothetical protein
MSKVQLYHYMRAYYHSVARCTETFKYSYEVDRRTDGRTSGFSNPEMSSIVGLEIWVIWASLSWSRTLFQLRERSGCIIWSNMVQFLLKCSPGIKNLTSAMCAIFREGPIVLNSAVRRRSRKKTIMRPLRLGASEAVVTVDMPVSDVFILNKYGLSSIYRHIDIHEHIQCVDSELVCCLDWFLLRCWRLRV